jgi:hypothetical protein
MNQKKIAIISRVKSNAFIKILKHLEIDFELFDNCENIEQIRELNALVIFSDTYPKLPNNVPQLQKLIYEFQNQGKPIFCEFLPLPNILTENIFSKDYLRLVSLPVKSSILEGIEELSLFETHQNPFLTVVPNNKDQYVELLKFGKVAGVYNAIYGLPNKTYLGLGIQDKLLFSTIKISDFDRMEFRLKVRFGHLIINICKFLCEGWKTITDMKDSALNPYDNSKFMDPIKNINQIQRNQHYIQTVVNGLDWFEKSKMFPKPLGEGGVYEGFTSAFDSEGKKSYRFSYKNQDKLDYWDQRGDCTADSAISFFLASLIPPQDNYSAVKQQQYANTSKNLFDELYGYWQYYPEDQSIMRGFFGWANHPIPMTIFYSDDNGRDVFESLLYAYIKKDRKLFQCSYAGVNALLSTTGTNGHRKASIHLTDIYKRGGRKWFRNHKTKKKEYTSAHYGAWTFAALLYGAFLIQDQDIITLVGNGVKEYMKKFPKLSVEHSVGDDFSKLLVASVILYKCTNNPKHLEYVNRIIDFFEPYQDEYSGAFQEVDPFQKHRRTEKTNEKYGSGESALYTSSSDTISDQLYSLGFMGIGLYFAYKTGECPKAHKMLIKLLDYLCMIQLKSANLQLDGTWTRGFDYKHGEPYGANGDVGWGAYSIETGWTVGPILTSMTMYLLDFDPFEKIDPTFQQQIRDDFEIEKSIQAKIEVNWKESTPNVPPDIRDMSLEELKKLLQHFKINSLG